VLGLALGCQTVFWGRPDADIDLGRLVGAHFQVSPSKGHLGGLSGGRG
jgi:hypothetical protein